MTSTASITQQDHVRGPRNAAVSLVEYGDYECPYCRRAYAIVEEVLRQMPNVQYVYRHFPLVTMHPHALHAAEAAESAGDQGKFWQMHGVLFENQGDLADESLAAYAAEIGLDPEAVLDDVVNEAHVEKIQSHVESGAKSGVHGTPTFFINGRRHEGSWDVEDLLMALRDAESGAQHVAR
jgi:protein-disulfide isomerase